VKRLQSTHAAGQRGFGLAELLVSMALGLVVVGGMLTLVISVRATSLGQSKLAQVQDDQRNALITLSTTVQNAGYFPSALSLTSNVANELPATGSFIAAGQILTGTSSTAPASDTLVARYEAAPADGTLDCAGNGNTTAANEVVTNAFSVDANANLVCQVTDGANAPNPPQILATGVRSFKVLYAVYTSGAAAPFLYLPASAMTAATWPNVVSVAATLTFVNPIAGQPGQPANLAPVTKTIALFNHV
jgi:type IV pilus assembly protein PilW